MSNHILLEACKQGNFQLAKESINISATDLNGGMAYACHGGYKELVLLMIEKGATDWEWGMASACRGGHKELILFMIDKGATDWNSGMSWACYRRNKELVLLMIEKGADIERCSYELNNEDIMRLIKIGIKNFGKYNVVAEQCYKDMIETENVLDELHIFPEFSRLINIY